MSNSTIMVPKAFANATMAEPMFSLTYFPVFLIVTSLIVVISLYVYDIFNDLYDVGGVSQWVNDTISIHCSETSSNQFYVLLSACLLCSCGLTWLLFMEMPYRIESNSLFILWYSMDLISAIICFPLIGIFPTHGSTTRQQIGRTTRREVVDEENGTIINQNTIRHYKIVNRYDKLIIFGKTTATSRNLSRWIHSVAALFVMIEITISNIVYSFFTIENGDLHDILFQSLSLITLISFICLLICQGVIRVCSVASKEKSRAILYMTSMISELIMILLAIVTMMLIILHRDRRVLWIFSSCLGLKT